MHPRIIGLVGPIRAGKTVASHHLQQRYGYHRQSNSEILVRIATNLGMEPHRENLKRLGDSIFSVLGNDTIARFRLASHGDDKIIIDGIRYKEEVDAYARQPFFKLLAVTASDEIRFQRAIAASAGKDTSQTLEQFTQLRFARSESEVEELIRRADAAIVNDGSLESFQQQIDFTMAQWCA